MMLSIWNQTQLMRREWPRFKVLTRNRWDVVWEGPLKPLSQIYTIRVRLQRKKNHNMTYFPKTLPTVTVIDPLLRPRPEDPSDPIPHHYPNKEHPERPILCLYDPVSKEWHHRRSIARFIIPWTIEWLACYEGWLATGEWTGGGRHG